MNQRVQYIARTQWKKSDGHLRIKRAAKWAPTTERLLRQYDRHLAQVAGLAETTRSVYWLFVGQFLQWRYGRRRSLRFGVLTTRDISTFIQHRGALLQCSSLHVLAAALRSFFLFLHFIGRVTERLAAAVVCPAPWPPSRIPKTLSEDELRRFLSAFNRTQPIGQRDFAMAMCLCRLGMRAHEVALLELTDVDDHAQILHLRLTKTRRVRLLPLPPEVQRRFERMWRQGALHGFVICSQLTSKPSNKNASHPGWDD